MDENEPVIVQPPSRNPDKLSQEEGPKQRPKSSKKRKLPSSITVKKQSKPHGETPSKLLQTHITANSFLSQPERLEQLKSVNTPVHEQDKPSKTFQTYEIEEIKIQFPFKPYPSQMEMMTKLIKACCTSENALLESPTGTGKTLALLVSSLAWQDAHYKKIVENLEKEMIKRTNSTPSTENKSPVISQYFKMENLSDPPSSHISATDTRLKLENDFSTEDNSLADSGVYVRMPGKPQIFFASRTQKQIQQVISELKRNTPYRPKMSILGSREFYCINPQARQADDINDACEKLVHDDGCVYYSRSKLLKEHRSFKPNGKMEIFDIEDLNEFGRAHSGCPYYLSRNLVMEADIVFMPYNYLIDPLIRESSDINLEGNVVIVDEAHNVEDTSASSATMEFSLADIKRTFKDLNDRLNYNRLSSEFKSCLNVLQGLLIFEPEFTQTFPITDSEQSCKVFSGKQMSVILKKTGLDMELISLFHEAYSRIKQVILEESRRKTGNILIHPASLIVLRSLALILRLLWEHKNDYKIVLIKRMRYTVDVASPSENFLIGFWCLDSSVIFKPIASAARTVILTSGTLSPMNTFASELGASFEEQLEADHVIDSKQVWVGALGYGPSGQQLLGNFQSYNSPEYQRELGIALLRIVKIIPKGILVFMPSYGCMEKLMRAWEGDNGLLPLLEKEKQIFEEPRTGKMDFDRVMKEYENAIFQENGKGAILFCVQRGKMSEGIDFSDDRARAVVCIGIPYPNYKDLRVSLKKEYNNNNVSKRKLLPGGEWYKIQAFRALNQSLGRCIRHRNDWGAIILLDSRFENPSTISNLSKWLRSKVQSFPKLQLAANSLKAFVNDQSQTSLIENSVKLEQESWAVSGYEFV